LVDMVDEALAEPANRSRLEHYEIDPSSLRDKVLADADEVLATANAELTALQRSREVNGLTGPPVATPPTAGGRGGLLVARGGVGGLSGFGLLVWWLWGPTSRWITVPGAAVVWGLLDLVVVLIGLALARAGIGGLLGPREVYRSEAEESWRRAVRVKGVDPAV